MDRPTQKITLPFSGREVEVISYFTRGEKNEIQSEMLRGARMENGQPVFDDLSLAIKARDKTISLAVKNMTIDEINNLPSIDSDFLEEEINKISEPKKK